MDFTWIILREPGRVPERKGPFRPEQIKDFLLEVFDARPAAHVTVLTVGSSGPDVQDGPECLEMIDARYRHRARRHRESTRRAWALAGA